MNRTCCPAQLDWQVVLEVKLYEGGFDLLESLLRKILEDAVSLTRFDIAQWNPSTEGVELSIDRNSSILVRPRSNLI